MELTAEKVAEEEYFGIAAVFDRFGSLENIVMQALADEPYWQEHRRNQEQCLQAVGDNDGF